jgi:hypothetical protein
MKLRYVITLILFIAALTIVAQTGKGEKRGESLVYADSLDRVAAEVNGEELTLREVAFYVAYEEAVVEEEALVYDSENPSRYWNARVEGGFVWAVARKSIIQMAIHDEIFCRMAEKDGLSLTASEKNKAGLKARDIWDDLCDRDGEEGLGVTEDDIKETSERAALAEKYQEIYAEMNDLSYEDLEFTGEAYEKLLEKQDYSIDEEVWNKVGIGTVTVNN